MKQKTKNVGMGIASPTEKCNDKHCPFHGDLQLHGKTFVGKIIKKSPHKTVTVEWPRIEFLPKFERYAKKRSRIKAHNPDCIDAKIGDKVTIIETRPISKTKSFVVVRIDQ